ncbi:MAG: endolytic transglycosylase MltG [Lachnospiraceae bacterium]|nr:endolytic transglycosylase MltG [Lachnospiraceae bacterium]
MKHKYFLRGVGLGIMISAILLSISYNFKSISDEEIISRAKKLGMVYEDDTIQATYIPLMTNMPEMTLDPQMTNEPSKGEVSGEGEVSDDVNDVTEQPTVSDDAADVTEAPSVHDDTTGVPESPIVPEDTTNVTDSPTVSDDVANVTEPPVVTSKETNDKKESEKVVKAVLKINRGDWSRIVSENLEKLGIIEDSAAFDKYLVDNNYAGRIIIGDFELSSDNSFKEIAEAITE